MIDLSISFPFLLSAIPEKIMILRRSIAFALAALSLFNMTVSHCAADDSEYQLGPDSQKQDGVPEGVVTEHVHKSKVFKGTIRRYYVYVPKQYDGSKPASLIVFQDGHAYLNKTGQVRATVVMDNLIHSGEIPIMIGLFVDPGHKKDKLPEKPGWDPQPENRSFEYDTLSDAYSKMILDELLPKLEKEYSISKDPNDRAICGMSSGGICAFTVAWERPDAFRKVISHIGSFVDLRGGHVYPALVRKAEPKPLRVYLQDGSGDLDNPFGNWPLANQMMANSLAYKKYDYKFEYGTGAHSAAHGGAVFPDTMRWIWRKD
jgi:enterochelin esterase-like enzyme